MILVLRAGLESVEWSLIPIDVSLSPTTPLPTSHPIVFSLPFKIHSQASTSPRHTPAGDRVNNRLDVTRMQGHRTHSTANIETLRNEVYRLTNCPRETGLRSLGTCGRITG